MTKEGRKAFQARSLADDELVAAEWIPQFRVGTVLWIVLLLLSWADKLEGNKRDSARLMLKDVLSKLLLSRMESVPVGCWRDVQDCPKCKQTLPESLVCSHVDVMLCQHLGGNGELSVASLVHVLVEGFANLRQKCKRWTSWYVRLVKHVSSELEFQLQQSDVFPEALEGEETSLRGPLKR
eukprot:2911578-Amphidinium_carterae.1